MLKREHLRVISLSACVLALVLGVWIFSDGMQLRQAEVGVPNLGPKLAMAGSAVVVLAIAGIAVTVLAFRTADPVTKTDELLRRPDLDLTGSSTAAE